MSTYLRKKHTAIQSYILVIGWIILAGVMLSAGPAAANVYLRRTDSE